MGFRNSLGASALALVLASVVFPTLAATGPNGGSPPLLVPTAPGVVVTSILSVGAAADNGYRMVGNPDGLSIVGNTDGTFTLLMNHELSGTNGAVRAHGSTGAFVSRWVIRASDLGVLSGRDFLRWPSALKTWDTATGNWLAGANTLARFCSADRANPLAYWNPATGKGARNAYLHLNGEETSPEGRVFAFVNGSDTAWELPSLGRMSVENAVANPFPQDKTVVAVTDDISVNGQVYIYVGNKQSTGNVIQKAGLHGGRLYAVKVTGDQNENTSDQPFGPLHDGTFSLVDVTPASYGAGSGATLNSNSVSAGATSFLRPEDSAWLGWRHPERLVFSTTSSTSGRSRIWQLAFTDITQPELGGAIGVLADGGLNGTVFQMADNIAVDLASGHLVFAEDVGNNSRLGKIWALDPGTGVVTELAAHDPNLFLVGAPDYLTQDEEASGIIDITWVFRGVPGYDITAYRYYLTTSMAHSSLGDPELVQFGQLLLLQVPIDLLR